MFAKKVPQLAMVGLRRSISFPPREILSHNCGIMILGFNGHATGASLNFSTLPDPPSPLLHTNLVSRFPVGVASLPCHSVRSMSSKGSPRMGSIMEHPKYKEMYELLVKDSNLDPLDIVCLYILSKGLLVNQDVLELDALSSYSHTSKKTKGNAKIREMEERGAVKVGKLNIKDDGAIEREFKALVDETKVNEKALMDELFAENVGGGSKWDEAFMLKRQLVGFKLLQMVENGNMRLPMKAHDRLGNILLGGKFTKKEDQAILAWVEKYGETGWTDLARSLGRNYLLAGPAVKTRYERLLVGKKGAFSQEEDDFIIREVIKQVPEAFEKPYHRTKVDFKTIASQMQKRTGKSLWGRLACRLHPTIMRYKAGTLDKDVRAELIQKVKENKWIFSADVKFDELALRPEFEGHNGASLCRLYTSMAGKARERFGLNSYKEVTVDQVEEWWNISNRISKTETQVEKEERIVEAYFEAKRQL